jgi:hypothetical protein
VRSAKEWATPRKSVSKRDALHCASAALNQEAPDAMRNVGSGGRRDGLLPGVRAQQTVDAVTWRRGFFFGE